jgi:hypothetical protein
MNLFNDSDLIITTDGGKVQSAGFTVFNRFLSNKVQPLYTINNTEINLDDREKVSSRFRGFVVPAGLQDQSLSSSSSRVDVDVDVEDEEEEEKDLYDLLLALNQTTIVKEEPDSTTSTRKSTKKNFLPNQQRSTKKNKNKK